MFAPASSQLTALGFFRRHRNAYLAGAVVLLATNVLALALPYVVKIAVDDIQRGAGLDDLRTCAFFIFAFALAYTFLRILSRVILFTAGRDIEGEIRRILYAKMQSLDASYFDQVPNGEFVSMLTNDTNVVRLLFGMGFLNLANGIVLYVLAASLVFYLNPYLGLWSVLPYVLVILLLRRVAPRFLKESHRVQEKVSDLTVFIQENISGQEVIRNHGSEETQNKRFDRTNQAYLDANMTLTAVRGLLFTSTGAIGGMGTLLVLGIGGRLVIEGQITLGDLVAFFGYLSLLTMPTLMFAFVISIWQRSRASLERMNAFLALKPLVDFPTRNRLEHIAAAPKTLAVRNLTFSYPMISRGTAFRSPQSPSLAMSIAPRREPVLKNVTLDFLPGRLNAIVGRVGCGKTTLANVLMKRYPVPQGAILVDSMDLNDLSEADVNRLYSFVPQEPFLFSLTLADNIAFGMPSNTGGEVATESSDFALVAELSGATLLGLAEGELGLTPETRAGERGTRLSGGQRQRVTLARALAKGAPVLILDEPFSHLDGDTAHKVMDMLRERGCTIIVITHKISLIQEAPRIVVMDDGKVSQVGTHAELMEKSPTYRELLALEELKQDG